MADNSLRTQSSARSRRSAALLSVLRSTAVSALVALIPLLVLSSTAIANGNGAGKSSAPGQQKKLVAAESPLPPQEEPVESQGEEAAPPPSDPTPPPTDPSTNDAKLTWAPPTLTAPTTINVADDQWYVSMDKNRDYILKVGHHRVCAEAGSNRAGLWLEGGRNIVLIGGRISIPCESTAYGRTGIKIRGATGTVHIEGVVIDASGGYLTDGIAIAAPEAIVQLQNLRIGPVFDHGSAHPDLVQVQAGVRALRVDKLTGATTFQGFFLHNEDGRAVSGCTVETCRTGSAAFRRVNIHTGTGLGAYKPSTVLWQSTKDIPVAISEFYVNLSGTTKDLGSIVHPTTNYVWDGDATRRAKLHTERPTVYWPSSNIDGEVWQGDPPSGDFVPAGTAGLGYMSPGYR